MTTLWQPGWQAAHAYALTAVVTPTTFAGFTWRCTTAGTSGNTEPTWPADPSVTPTVTDGTVTWSVGTGFRQALQAGLVGSSGIVTVFAHANPTIIRSVRSVKPFNFANVGLPCFYIGDLNEDIIWNAQSRTRRFTGFSAYLVDAMGSIDESNDRMNFAADVLTDLFFANYHAANGRSLFQHQATADAEQADGNSAAIYPALRFDFGPSQVTEGRP